MKYPECIKCSNSVAWIGIVSNVFLFAMKLSVGIFSRSQALIADSLYSLKDIASSLVILVSFKVTSKPIDADHPYGHEKAEFFATLVISIFLFGTSVVIFIYSLDTIFNQPPVKPHLIALFAGIISVMCNIYLFNYNDCVAYQSNSPLIATTAKHHESDALSSSLVIVAVSAAHFGITILDPIVALIETGHLGLLSFFLLRDSYHGLMDKSIPEKSNNLIKKVTKKVSGVESVPMIRTRRMGHKVWIDLTIGVQKQVSIERARGIAETVEEELLSNVPHTSNVLVRFAGHQEEGKP